MPIGEWVLRTACAAGAQVAREGLPEPHASSVNLSSRQFQQADLVSQVTHALDETGSRPRQARPRDHRVQRHAERGALDQHAPGPQEAGRPHLDGRLRDRLLVAQLPEALPDRPHQARPVLRARPPERQGRRRHRDGRHRDGAQPRARRHRRGRRDRGAARLPAAATTATSSRASCSRGPWPPEAFDQFLDESRGPAAALERARFARAN